MTTTAARQDRCLKTAELSEVQRLKLVVLEKGVSLTPAAILALRDVIGDRPLSSHDFASTSGLIIELENDTWVNAPLELYNPNFVSQTPCYLDFDEGFTLTGSGVSSRAAVWRQPAYHGGMATGDPLNDLIVTHGDRARVSPIRSCAMTCTFCNIPYDDPIGVYRLKPIAALHAAIEIALNDPVQPALHLLISGGTPKPKDVPWLREFYASTLGKFPGVPIDIMMTPVPGLFDLRELAALRVNELSINIEVFNRDRARQLMRNKYNQGIAAYLNVIEAAAVELGLGRARSMLMVGLEPLEDTLAGVRAIAERGGTPVLSPFRPDPVTPLRALRPPSAGVMEYTYLAAAEIADEFGVALGPDCAACTHNTISFADHERRSANRSNRRPTMIGSL